MHARTELWQRRQYSLAGIDNQGIVEEGRQIPRVDTVLRNKWKCEEMGE